MSSLPTKALERIKTSIKKFQPIVQSAKVRDVNESDTVTIIVDMLEHVFGYDKFHEITSEYAIRGTYCDLAVKSEGEPIFLVEVKAIGLALKEQFVKQAIDYAANQGIDWVVLTNAQEWRIYRVIFGKPIEFDLLETLSVADFSAKDKNHLEHWSLLAKEGMKKAVLEKHYTVKQLLNRFTIGAVIMSEPVIDVIKREMKRLCADVKMTEDDVRLLLQNEVIKREVLEGDKALSAQKMVNKAEKKLLRKIKDTSKPEDGTAAKSELVSKIVAA